MLLSSSHLHLALVYLSRASIHLPDVPHIPPAPRYKFLAQVGGLATIGQQPVVMAAYDYTVFAGTQGAMNHKKQDRLYALALARRLPVVLFAEVFFPL